MGGFAIHVPFHTTWPHEHVDHEVQHEEHLKVEIITGILAMLS